MYYTIKCFFFHIEGIYTPKEERQKEQGKIDKH